MQKMKIVFQRDINDFKHWKIFWLLIIILFIGAIGIALSMNYIALGIKDTNTAKGQLMWLAILGNVLVLYTLVPQIINVPMFCTMTLTKEKSNGIIMSLLATELKPSGIWFGKGLAAFLPGYFAAMISSAVLIPAFYRIVFIPFSVLLCALILIPLMMFLTAVISIQLSMIRNVEMAIAPSYIIGILLLFGIPLGSISGLYGIASARFAVICAILVFLFLAVEFILSKIMTKEAVILAQSK